LSDEETLGRCREISSVFATVEHMLDEENLGTFSHMITRAYALLQADPKLLAQEQQKTRFILVDEFQDANFAQVKILQKLAAREGRPLQSNPVDAVLLAAREVESSDLVNQIQQMQRAARALWSDFAVLYRLHSHREYIASELAEHGIPFSIENMDVMDTPEA